MGIRYLVSLCIVLCPMASDSAFAADTASTDADGVVTWVPATPAANVTGEYKPTRWGMYDIEVQLDTPAAGKVKLTLAGKELNGTSDGSSAIVKLGRDYVDKTDQQPVSIRTEPADPAKPLVVKSLLLTPAPEGKPIVQSDDLSITLHAARRDGARRYFAVRIEAGEEYSWLVV